MVLTILLPSSHTRPTGGEASELPRPSLLKSHVTTRRQIANETTRARLATTNRGRG